MPCFDKANKRFGVLEQEQGRIMAFILKRLMIPGCPRRSPEQISPVLGGNIGR